MIIKHSAYLNVMSFTLTADTYSLIPVTNTEKVITKSIEIFKKSNIWANSNENWIGQKQYCRRSTL